MYALVIDATIQGIYGRLPSAAVDTTTGEWVCPDGGLWTQEQAARCGYFEVIESPPPADTATTRWEAAYDAVFTNGATSVLQSWIEVPKTQEEIDADDRAANEQAIRDKASAALTSNAAFLALNPPTNAQTLKQVQDLTKQMNGLIRLTLRDLDNISGT